LGRLPTSSEGNHNRTMKFGEKYELLESLTTGAVETFIANDKVRGERVLVHILDCGPQKPNQPTVQWVLEAFRRVAPEPAGLVLETGRYSGTLYAYLVTKMPDEASLAGWKRMYRTQAQDTQEIPRPPAQPTPESEAPTAEGIATRPAREPGVFTQAFREFESGPKPVPSPLPKKTEQPARPLPERPLPDFSTSSPSGPRAATPPDPMSYFAPKNVPENKSPTDLFRSDFTPKNLPPEPSSPPINDGAKAGEFTSFFQGPFSGERSSEIPALSNQEMEPPKKSVGEFTAMFGAARQEGAGTAPGPGGQEPPRDEGSFTKLFRDLDIPKTPGPPAPPMSIGLPRPLETPPAFPAPPNESFAPPPPPAYVPPVPPAYPSPPMPAMPAVDTPKAATPPTPGSPDGATRAFSFPGLEPAPSQPVFTSGPSEYTRIISGVKSTGAAGEAAAKPPAPASMPSMPAMAPPPMPAVTMPAPPPAPKAPAITAPQPPAVSYWPLVLTLTVLSFIAVLLVLYFALRGH
jgi:hypothetical protein